MKGNVNYECHGFSQSVFEYMHVHKYEYVRMKLAPKHFGFRCFRFFEPLKHLRRGRASDSSAFICPREKGGSFNTNSEDNQLTGGSNLLDVCSDCSNKFFPSIEFTSCLEGTHVIF